MINSLTLLFQFLLNEPDLLSEHLFKFMKTFQIFFFLPDGTLHVSQKSSYFN